MRLSSRGWINFLKDGENCHTPSPNAGFLTTESSSMEARTTRWRFALPATRFGPRQRDGGRFQKSGCSLSGQYLLLLIFLIQHRTSRRRVDSLTRSSKKQNRVSGSDLAHPPACPSIAACPGIAHGASPTHVRGVPPEPSIHRHRHRRSACADASLRAEIERVERMTIKERVKAALTMRDRFEWLLPVPRRQDSTERRRAACRRKNPPSRK